MTESSEIHRLDPQTVERIAAGEVVERPASAVKELIENSIDADATRVTVAVEAGGTECIRVTDDGIGMDEAALRRAVEEHTTSKIADIDDLEGGVATLGFRGEALHAVGAVSRMTITSRPRGGDRGTELTVEGGDITAVSPAGSPEGTTVEVHDLFYNVPARRKYLKQESTEFAHVNTVVTSYALANPDVAVTLEHSGRETFATTGTGDLREAILAVYGREVAEAMVPVEASTDAAVETAETDSLPDGPLTGISGLVSHPETNRASREYLSTFVNGRYVTADVVRKAVVDAYGTQLADRYPFAVLFLELDPATVDVNVHPRKLNVRFADEEGVRKQVRTAIEESLLDVGLLRSSAPRGRSAPEQTEIRPEAHASSETAADREEVEPSTTDESIPEIDATTPAELPEETPVHERPQEETAPTGESPVGLGTEPDTHVEEDGRTPADETTAGESTDSNSPSLSNQERPSSGQSREEASDIERRKFLHRGRQARLVETDTHRTSPDSEQDIEFESLPSMRILGQFQETYVVAETADGLVLIDQHAADERINYERLRESLAGETTTQALATPVHLDVTAREAELFAAHRDALTRLGFHATLVDDRTVEVSTVPSLVAEAAGPELVRDVLSAFVTGETAATKTVEAAADKLLADLACYPSITGNTSLSEGSVLDLLSSLDACDNPYACPHGRPVVVEFDTDDIEGRFERDYPGHH